MYCIVSSFRPFTTERGTWPPLSTLNYIRCLPAPTQRATLCCCQAPMLPSHSSPFYHKRREVSRSRVKVLLDGWLVEKCSPHRHNRLCGPYLYRLYARWECSSYASQIYISSSRSLCPTCACLTRLCCAQWYVI